MSSQEELRQRRRERILQQGQSRLERISQSLLKDFKENSNDDDDGPPSAAKKPLQVAQHFPTTAKVETKEFTEESAPSRKQSVPSTSLQSMKTEDNDENTPLARFVPGGPNNNLPPLPSGFEAADASGQFSVSETQLSLAEESQLVTRLLTIIGGSICAFLFICLALLVDIAIPDTTTAQTLYADNFRRAAEMLLFGGKSRVVWMKLMQSLAPITDGSLSSDVLSVTVSTPAVCVLKYHCIFG
jgi:hypothetical protein